MSPDQRPSRRWRWLTVALCALALHAAKPALGGFGSSGGERVAHAGARASAR